MEGGCVLTLLYLKIRRYHFLAHWTVDTIALLMALTF